MCGSSAHRLPKTKLSFCCAPASPALSTMKPHLLATPLVAATLLLSILGCSKKDEDAKPVVTPNVGSYKLDGQLFDREAKAFEYPNRTGFYEDQLQIQLTSPVTAPTGPDNLLLAFGKPVGSPVSAYRFINATLITWPTGSSPLQTSTFAKDLKFTLSTTPAGGYSGTFSASNNGSSSLITDGVFTDARP